MDVKNIADATVEEVKELLDSIDTVIFDCDGVLWHIQEPIDGTKECLAALQSYGKKLKFISNNSVRPQESYDEMFDRIGVTIDDNDLIHPVRSIVKYLKRINFDGLIYCIGCTQFKSVLRSAGFELIDDPMEIIPESFSLAFKKIIAPAPVKAVVVDVDFNCSHPKIARAAYFLSRPDVLFIAGATDTKLPLNKTISILGPGYFTKIIMEHTQRKPLILSKPSIDLAQEVVKDYGKNCLFIGDAVEQDMGFAMECGYKKLLVLSGAASKGDMEKQCDWSLKPDYYAESLKEFYEAIQKLP